MAAETKAQELVDDRRKEQMRISAERFRARKESRAQEGKPADEGGRSLDTEERVMTRTSLIDPLDGLGLERLMGKNDLLSINYLEIGIRRARSVGRIQIRDLSGRVLGFGSGFLISPSLLITNNHVLANATEAQRSLVDFDFQDDVDFHPKAIATFELHPDSLFHTNKELDFTVVAVKTTSIDGRSLSEYGMLELLPQSGKALVDESVSIIQHPSGASKQIALRENKIVDLPTDFIHYQTDTQPGSSGSAVFNDQWLVVALHHSAIPSMNSQGKYLAKDGKIWKPEMGEDAIDWVANEGVRVSSIMDTLWAEPGWTATQRMLLSGIPTSPMKNLPDGAGAGVIASGGAPGPIEVRLLSFESYTGRKGYDPEFLGVEVPMPELSAALQQDAAQLDSSSGHELKYTHFSVIMSKSRKMARVTAVNIDGAKSFDLGPRENDRWYFDPRIPREYQSGPELYSNNALDRGHLVRRLDPVWGSETAAQLANEDTFHFTNCSPQHKNLNQKLWLELEEFILQNAVNYGFRASVFTGPVFRDDDMVYRDSFLIPVEYWKVVAMVNQGTKQLSVTAYLRTQKKLIVDLEFAYADEFKTYQVPVARIEKLTGLDFGGLRKFDPLFGQESSTTVRELRGPADLRL